DYATNVLVQQLSQIRGVGQVEVGGSSLPAVRVEINPRPLFRYGIGFEDIRAALASANAHTPKGIIDQNGLRYTLDTNDQARDAQSYRDLIVAWRNNRPVHLSDVARVDDSVEDLHNAGFFNSSPSVIAVVFAQAGANVIQTVDEIKAKFPLLRAALPGGVDLHIGLDRSLTIRASLADTQYTLVISVILVVLVVLLFLHSWRMTLIPAIVVPTSIVATFGAMRLLDYSLDNMSLMALTVSTGFVVDDAIVVIENISRYIEEGFSPRDAALKGSQEVAFTVISISISLIAVFLPILLLGGLAGRLFHEFAMTVSITILISMVLSLTLTPMMAAQILSATPHTTQPAKTTLLTRIAATISRFLDSVQNGYARSLNVALRHYWLILLSLPATLVIIVALFIQMPKGFFPTEDTGMLMGHLRGDQSISFQALSKKLTQVQNTITQDPDVQSVASFMGGRGSSNSANMFLQLKDKADRHDTPTELIARVESKLSNIVGADFFLMQPGAVRAGARQSNAAYQYTLEGEDATELYHWTNLLLAELQKHKELTEVSADVQQGGLAIAVGITRDTAARVNVTPQMLSNTIYDAFGQRAASVIYNTLNQYRVVMEADPASWSSPNDLNQVWVSVSGGSAGGGTRSNTVRVRNSGTSSAGNSASASLSAQSFKNQIANALAGGNGASTGSAVSTSSSSMVPLTFVSSIKPARTPLAVNHQGQAVAATLSFNLAQGVSLGAATQIIEAAQVSLHMPQTIHGSFAGNAAQFQKTVNNEPLLILAALIAVYVVLGVLYESYIHPLTILSTLPSAGVGALLALQLAGEEFSLIAMIGVILLIGIVKKNAIMLVDFAIAAEREHNLPPLEAIRTACLLRFRPIMMTSLAAALGAAPLIIANGYGAELRRPLGIAIVGGLVVSQALTLYTTPVVYLLLDNLRLRFKNGKLWRPSFLRNLQDT
ncbi:MAG: efflux RND transporter permease subunit, partial [Acetobacter sp.]|nr:efflux RND transporter permease subunit [Acetobacter sp.]